MPVEAIFFNVGQGDCTLLWFYERGVDPATGTGTHAVLIDCGSSGAVAPMTQPAGARGTASALMVAHLKAKLADYLGRLNNPHTLDSLIITHPDKDHFNLLHKVLLDPSGKLAYTIKTLYYTLDPEDYREGNGTFMKDLLTNPDKFTIIGGHKVETRPAQMYVPAEPISILAREPEQSNLFMIGGLFAPTSSNRNLSKEVIANQSSLVTLLQGEWDERGDSQRVLLMGDAVEINEQSLIGFDVDDEWFRRQSNLWLKMGHHGSETSTFDGWIEHITPDGMFVSTGLVQFRGASSTFTEANIRDRVLPTWERVRGARGIPHPAVIPDNRIYGYQQTANPSEIWAVRTDEGVFSSFCQPESAIAGGAMLNTPLRTGNRDSWRGVDWHLRLDHDRDGTYSIHAE